MVFEDVENLVCDLLAPVVKESTPGTFLVTWVPDDYAQVIEAHPLVVIQRIGGSVSRSGTVDEALVEIGVIDKTRAGAWKMMGYIRAWLLSEEPHKTGVFGSITETSGPVQPSWANPDYRWVRHVFQFNVRRRREGD